MAESVQVGEVVEEDVELESGRSIAKMYVHESNGGHDLTIRQLRNEGFGDLWHRLADVRIFDEVREKGAVGSVERLVGELNDVQEVLPFRRLVLLLEERRSCRVDDGKEELLWQVLEARRGEVGQGCASFGMGYELKARRRPVSDREARANEGKEGEEQRREVRGGQSVELRSPARLRRL